MPFILLLRIHTCSVLPFYVRVRKNSHGESERIHTCPVLLSLYESWKEFRSQNWRSVCVVVFVGGTVIPTVLQETEVDAFTHLPRRSYRKERGNVRLRDRGRMCDTKKKVKFLICPKSVVRVEF